MKSLQSLYKIGPGPSSSHAIGPKRACEYILNKYKDIITTNSIKVILYESLAFTGKGHLTDKIIENTLKDRLNEIIFNYKEETKHPNTMDFIILKDNKEVVKERIESIGGGDLSIDTIEKEIYPFKTFEEIKNYCKTNNCNLYDLVYQFENNNINDYLKIIWEKMKGSISEGLNSTGTLPGPLKVIKKANTIYNSNNEDLKLKYVSAYAFAVSEQNADGKDIVTAPTCGSAGVIPAILYYCYKHEFVDENTIIKALASASIIGNLIRQNASISGAYAGCQSEIGTACTMGAVAYSFIHGMNIDEMETAAEMALEHHLGLTCDPINGQVQIPCIERNAVAALRAIDSSNLAKLIKGTNKINLDTVIKTMYETGIDLSSNYKETSKAGLAKIYYEK